MLRGVCIFLQSECSVIAITGFGKGLAEDLTAVFQSKNSFPESGFLLPQTIQAADYTQPFV